MTWCRHTWPDRGLEEQKLLDEAAELLKLAKQKVQVAHIAAELQRQDLVLAPKPTDELVQMRVLIGEKSWKKSRRLWKRRLKQNVTAFRKVLIVLRNLTQKN